MFELEREIGGYKWKERMNEIPEAANQGTPSGDTPTIIEKTPPLYLQKKLHSHNGESSCRSMIGSPTGSRYSTIGTTKALRLCTSPKRITATSLSLSSWTSAQRPIAPAHHFYLGSKWRNPPADVLLLDPTGWKAYWFRLRDCRCSQSKPGRLISP